MVAKIYCGLGLLKRENIREVHRADLIGQHIGETEAKTNAIIDSALDGVLFLDEAYALVATGARTTSGWWPLTPCWPGWKTTATGWWSSSPAIAPTWTNSWTPTRDFGRVSPATSTFLLHVP